MTSIDQAKPTSFDLEEYEDARGIKVLLPWNLQVTECCWCNRVQTRRSIVEACGYLNQLCRIGKLGMTSGTSDTGRPYCHDCAPDLGAAEAQMPLRLFGAGPDDCVADGVADDVARAIEEGGN
jgi:hypothetical protein